MMTDSFGEVRRRLSRDVRKLIVAATLTSTIVSAVAATFMALAVADLFGG